MVKKQYRVSLREYNTFGIDARTECLCGFSSVEDLAELHREGLFKGMWNVISGGSNILFTGDYPGVLLHPEENSITETSRSGDSVAIRAGAGMVWDEFVGYCAERGLWGAENLSYIPGYVGAAPVQNIGAYGAEAKDIIESVELFSVESGSRLTLARDHCGFGYRTSVFKTALRGKAVITAVNFRLSTRPRPSLGYGDLRDTVGSMGGPDLNIIRRAVTAIRKAKLPEPSELGNAGSFFKNPVVKRSVAEGLKKEYPDMPLYPSGTDGYDKLAAGWLVDRCGWKGRSLGRAAVHDKQALVLVNRGGATGREILDLAAAVTGDVKEKFGVALESEVNVL